MDCRFKVKDLEARCGERTQSETTRYTHSGNVCQASASEMRYSTIGQVFEAASTSFHVGQMVDEHRGCR